MKKILMLMTGAILLLAFVSHTKFDTEIKGRIVPADAATKVWAINGADSVSTIPVEGNFSLKVKPGVWMLIVEAGTPYKPYSKEGINVLEEQPVDLGLIELQKE